jgi:hypothetical protein
MYNKRANFMISVIVEKENPGLILLMASKVQDFSS